MKLDLFSFIDETMAYYKSKSAIYQYAEGKLNQFFSDEFLNGEDPVISLRSRIKAEDSLKEKLIRNQFYLQYEAGKDAISHLTDLIGITMQCRFIRNKSLVHAFWSEIEHEVVYKNPDFILYDQFNKDMLGAIRDNLDVVDRQLEIMYDEISHQSKQTQIGMDEVGFKQFVARSINELVNRKMRESVGFTSDFKKCSAMIAQYVYVRDFINGEHNKERMMDYLETLNMLATSKLDLSEEIHLEREHQTNDEFCRIFAKYWQEQLNSNFQWHIFFAMLFSIQPGSNIDDFTDFCIIIKRLLIEPNWYRNTFKQFDDDKALAIQNELELVLANALVAIDDIEIVHEDKVYLCMQTFRHYVTQLENEYDDYKEFIEYYDKNKLELARLITDHFH